MTRRSLLPSAGRALAAGLLLCATASAQVNDECSGALTVSLGLTPFDNTTATLSPAGGFQCEGNVGADLWYRFTPAATDYYRFSLCTSNFDTVIEVREGDCTTSTVVGCADDQCVFASFTTVLCTAGQDYLVRVAGWGTSRGQGDLEITDGALRDLSLAGHWRLDETTGTTAADASGNGANGLYQNVGLGLGGAAPTTGASADFDGTSSSVDIPVIGPIDELQNDLSVAAWINLDTLPPGTSTYRVFGHEGPARGWSFGVKDSTGLVFTVPGILDYIIPATLVTGTWHHVAAVMSTDNNVTFYLDGALLGTVNGPEPGKRLGTTCYIGAWSPGFSIPEFFDGQIDDVQVYGGQLTASDVSSLHANPGSVAVGAEFGALYCTGNPNSSGAVGLITAVGSPIASVNDVTLVASQLPLNQFGIFVVSRLQGFTPMAGGGQGNICLGSNIGRLDESNQIVSSGATGSFSLRIDLTMIPNAVAFESAMAGDTFNFQAWHRDLFMGVPTSNFTRGLEVLFQ